MHRFNPLRLGIHLFNKSAFFNVLRMTSKALFLTLFFGCFIVLQPLGFKVKDAPVFFFAYILMTLLDILFFEVLKLKESSFKDAKAFFKKNRFSPKRLDWHARFITRLRVAFLVVFLPGCALLNQSFFSCMLLFMFGFSFISAEIYLGKVAKKSPFLKAWSKHTGNGYRPGSGDMNVGGSGYTSNLPPNFGVSGYGIAGTFTGSSTAVGGISN